MQKIAKIIVIIVVALFVLALAKNFIVKKSVEAGVQAVTGMPLRIGGLSIGIPTTKINIRDLRMYNPKDYPEKVMLHMPEIYVDYNLVPLLKGKIDIDSIRVNMAEFNVVKNKDGNVNVNELKSAVAKEEPAPEEEPKPTKKAEMPEMHIDSLELKVGKVTLKDYSKGEEPSVKEYNVNLNERYENIENPQALIGLIVFKALVRTSIAGIANIDMSGFKDVASDALASAKEVTAKAMETTKKAVDTTTKAAKDVADKTKDTLKDTSEKIGDLLPFGDKK